MSKVIYDLAHCVVGVHLSPPSRKRQGGVNRVPQALQACILTITRLTFTRLPGRTEARPYDRMVFSAMYYVENE